MTVPAELRLRVEDLEAETLPNGCVLTRKHGGNLPEVLHGGGWPLILPGPGEPTPAWAKAANEADARTLTQAHAGRIIGLLR